MIGKLPPLAGGISFVKGRVTTRPGSVLRQHAALAWQSRARTRHAEVCGAQADGENQADEVLQVIMGRTIATGEILACMCMRIAADMRMATAAL
jgi:hypothetical protein